jgi:hypothetical protein
VKGGQLRVNTRALTLATKILEVPYEHNEDGETVTLTRMDWYVLIEHAEELREALRGPGSDLNSPLKPSGL